MKPEKNYIQVEAEMIAGTDIRLWLRKEIDNLEILLTDLQKSFFYLAESNIYTLIPGYTHMQRATIIFSSSFIGLFRMFQRDRERFQEVREKSIFPSLGAAALAGTKIKIDRNFTAISWALKRFIKIVLMQ